MKLYEYLSRNKTKSMLNETEEEGLLGLLRSLVATQDRDKILKLATDEESEFRITLKGIQAWALNRSRISNVWNSEHTVRFLLEVYRCGPHLIESKLTHVHWLARMANIHGGVCSFSLSLLLYANE